MIRGWLYKFLNNRGNVGPGEPPEGTMCRVPGCKEPAVESWFPGFCALREAGVKIDWVHVCAEHDVQSNEQSVRFFFGDQYDEELKAYRERRMRTQESGVYLSVHDSGHGLQLSIDEVEVNGGSTGYRLKGPKFMGTSRPVLMHRLSERDVDQLRGYLNKVKKYE